MGKTRGEKGSYFQRVLSSTEFFKYNFHNHQKTTIYSFLLFHCFPILGSGSGQDDSVMNARWYMNHLFFNSKNQHLVIQETVQSM